MTAYQQRISTTVVLAYLHDSFKSDNGLKLDLLSLSRVHGSGLKPVLHLGQVQHLDVVKTLLHVGLDLHVRAGREGKAHNLNGRRLVLHVSPHMYSCHVWNNDHMLPHVMYWAILIPCGPCTSFPLHVHVCCQIHTLYSTRMSPENTHKLVGFYMEVLILGITL